MNVQSRSSETGNVGNPPALQNSRYHRWPLLYTLLVDGASALLIRSLARPSRCPMSRDTLSPSVLLSSPGLNTAHNVPVEQEERKRRGYCEINCQLFHYLFLGYDPL